MIIYDANTFFKENGVWIALGVVGLILLTVLCIFLTGFSKKKKVKNKETIYGLFLEAIGGKENIISSSAKGSRLSLVLKSYELDEKKLEAAGVSSSIRMSNKITFVVQNAETINEWIQKQI